MFTQPTVNQIASTYQGNPAPLARKVDQDKKQNGGIPKDLRQLMALNDIAQGKNSVGIDQALQIPTNMPTVAQATQAQAQQAIQARLMQMAREQQRLQQKPPVLPLGTPQPEEQPQGLDSLSTNVGDAYAEGGIIGFDGTGSSQFVQDVSSLPQAFDEMKKRIREEDEIKAAQDRRMAQRKQEALDARSKTSFFNYLFGSPEREKEGEAKLTELSNTPINAPEKPPATVATPPANIRSQLNLADAGIRAQPGTPPPPREKPATQTQTRVNADSAPMPGELKGLAGIPSMGVARAYERDMLKQDPAKAMADLEAEYNRKVGARDMSAYDRSIAELEARKQKLAQQREPKSGFEGLMDYLDNIAEAGGKTWYDAGSRGGSLQKKKRLALEEQENTLMDKIIELGGKKSEALFAEKKGMFDLTQAEKNRIIKDKQEIAKSLGLSEDDERRLIEQSLQKELDRKNNIRAAAVGSRDNLMNRAAAIRAENKGMSVEESMKRAAIAGGATQMESANVRDTKAYTDAKEKLDARFQHLISDTPYGKKQKELYDTALADLRSTHGMTGGINTLPKAQAAPLPSKNQLVVGQIYQTARGPATWNGTAFEQ
jgi:hypothetical protein